MDKSDPINLPATVTVALRHKIMTRRIAQQSGEVQYMLKQGSSWHDITDYYRARKKAVNLKVETGDKGVTNSPKKIRQEKSQKKTKVQEEPVAKGKPCRRLMKNGRKSLVREIKKAGDPSIFDPNSNDVI